MSPQYPKPEALAVALDGTKVGKSYKALCPAHADNSPSLSISEGRGGQVLVYCFSGCRQEDVISALQDRGLWPKPQREKAPVINIESRRDLKGQCRALKQAIRNGTASTRQQREYRQAIARLCSPYTPDEVVLAHHWCVHFSQLVRSGGTPTKSEERDFLKFSRIVHRCGVPYAG